MDKEAVPGELLARIITRGNSKKIKNTDVAS
jgi:hypothetical protein